MIKLDTTYKKIIQLMQQNANVPIATLAIQAKISKTACWNRIQKLFEEKIIKCQTIELDLNKIGYHLHALVMIKTNQHDKHWINDFVEHVRSLTYVISFYRLTGEVDYVLEIVAKDVNHYNEVYEQLISKCQIASVSTHIIMQEERKDVDVCAV